MRCRRLIPSLAVLALLSGGCGIGADRTLNAKSLDSQIVRQLKARYPANRVTVTCPGGVKEKAGNNFSCVAFLDGQKLNLTGTVTSSGGRYSIQPAEAVVVSTQAATTLENQISAQLRESVSVDCGPSAFRIVPAGGQFNCTANLPGQSPRRVTVSVLDTTGNMRFSLTTS